MAEFLHFVIFFYFGSIYLAGDGVVVVEVAKIFQLACSQEMFKLISFSVSKIKIGNYWILRDVSRLDGNFTVHLICFKNLQPITHLCTSISKFKYFLSLYRHIVLCRHATMYDFQDSNNIFWCKCSILLVSFIELYIVHVVSINSRNAAVFFFL